MKTLRYGKVNYTELAEWFGVSRGGLSNNKSKYLNLLKEYADYEIQNNKVFITKIKQEEYIPNFEKDMAVYFREVKAANEYLASVSGIAEKLFVDSDQDYAKLKLNSVRYRMTKAGNLAFVKTADENSSGKYGSRNYVWAIKLTDRPNHYRHLTIEENNQFDQILSTVYHADADKIKQAALYLDALKNGDMDKDEYCTRIEALDCNGFYEDMRLFKEKTGYQIVRATEHEIKTEYLESAF